jgi:hypothetical protein
MKSSYTAPKLIVHGNVAEITQILGNRTRADFAFLSGQSIAGDDDQGSRDQICTGTAQNPTCTGAPN